MLGRLFNVASASLQSVGARLPRSYDSNVEETITYDLLFPEVGTLQDAYKASHSNRHEQSIGAIARSGDDKDGMELHTPRDVRLLVAQKSLNIMEKPRVLFDSHPPSAPAPNRTSPSLSSEANGFVKQSRGLTGGYRKIQKARTAPHSRNSSLSQTPNAIFANPATPLSSVTENGGLFGTGTSRRPDTSEGDYIKAKIAREEREETDDILRCMFGAPESLCTSSTKVHPKPYTDKGHGFNRPGSSGSRKTRSPQHGENRRSLLIRSTTAENLAAQASEANDVTEGQLSRRTSSYVLITRLFTVPLGDRELNDALSSNTDGTSNGGDGDDAQVSETRTSEARFSSKQVKPPWFAIGLVIYIPMKPSQSLTPGFGRVQSSSWGPRYQADLMKIQLDDVLDRIMDRLPLIVRALAALETVADAGIKKILLGQYDGTVPSLRRALQLNPNALQEAKGLRESVTMTSKRVTVALQVRSVITGQNRWSLWKAVARELVHDGPHGGRGTFLAKVLTAFLSSHSEWLGLHAPRSYRHGKVNHRTAGREDVDVIGKRTVIVCANKMIARRVTFLLSQLMPKNFDLPQKEPETRDIYVTSTGKAKAPQWQDTDDGHDQDYLRPQPDTSDAADFASSDVNELRSPNKASHHRRPSDTLSIRSFAMPIANTASRKSSVTTTATTLPNLEQVPHFSPYSPDSATSPERPTSSGSFAALSLQRSLSRTESNGPGSLESKGNDAWGSFRSGFWSTRRGSSTEDSEMVSSSAEGLAIVVPPFLRKNSSSSPRKLGRMLHDGSESNGSVSHKPSSSVGTLTSPSKSRTFAPRSLPDFSPGEDTPLSLSFDRETGVVDVQLSHSFDDSPSQSRKPNQSFNTNSSCESSSSNFVYPPPVIHPQATAPNVAGYIRTFHPDFAVQAVRPSDSLRPDIKQAMQAEPRQERHGDSAGPEPNSKSTPDTTTTTPASPPLQTLLIDPTTSTLTLLTLTRPSLHDQSKDSWKEEDITSLPANHELETALATILAPTPSPSPTPDPKLDRLPHPMDPRTTLLGALTTLTREVAEEIEAERAYAPGKGVRVNGNGSVGEGRVEYSQESDKGPEAGRTSRDGSVDQGKSGVGERRKIGRERGEDRLRISVRAWMEGVRDGEEEGRRRG